MKNKIAGLTSIELRVYAEVAHASSEGLCNTPATVMRHRCGLITYFYNKTLAELKKKGLIAQEIICCGVPRVIKLIGK